MSYRLLRLNKILKDYDDELYVREAGGVRQVWRRAKTDPLNFVSNEKPQAHFILALTDNFNINGKPVDVGIEPLLAQLKSMDQWRDDSALSDVRGRREKAEYWSERTKRNTIRAQAADMRQDYAKSAWEIGTSTLEKKENRRNKDGNCK